MTKPRNQRYYGNDASVREETEREKALGIMQVIPSSQTLVVDTDKETPHPT
jgi:hypothetical protein